MRRPVHDYKTLNEFLTFLDTAVGYLEKANANDLGDFTTEGKTRNAGYNNYTVYWQWYKELGFGNAQGQAYCAGAVSTMMVNAFGLDRAKKLLCGALYTYCPTGYNQFNKAGRIYTTPKVGDVVFFWSTSLKRYGHTGIVYAVDKDGKGYTTWEANTSSGNDTVIRNGGATCKKHHTLGVNKVSFGRPDYEGNGISIDGNTTTVVTESNSNENSGLEEFKIESDSNGLKCTAAKSLNVRAIPSTGSVVNSIAKNEKVAPSKKCFVNGEAWYYIPAKDGWCSAKYLSGWVHEIDSDKWWYLLDGYNKYTDQLVSVNGKLYYFDSNGDKFIGTLTIETDSNGEIHSSSN